MAEAPSLYAESPKKLDQELANLPSLPPAIQGAEGAETYIACSAIAEVAESALVRALMC